MQADLVLTNGVVYTVDARRSRHEALAVKDGRIVALGSASEAAEWCGPRTRTVDLGGRLVLPGFIDAHLHPTYSTFELFEVKLADCRTLDDCLDRVARFAAQRPELPAIRGGGWFPTVVSMDGMTAAALDRVVPDRPVLLHDDSVHAHWVNSMTLRRAGIGRHDPGWPGAVIERLPDGSPKGLLHEAFLYLDRALPQYTARQHAEAMRHFQREIASRYGITMLHDAGVHGWSETVLDAYERLQADDELSLRVRLSMMFDPSEPLGDQLETAAEARARFSGPLVQAATVKLFCDGVLETHTGLLKEPYADTPGYAGTPVWEPERLVEASVAAAAAGFQLHYHAIGDGAAVLALDAISAARDGRPGGRDIITHLQVVDAADVARMAELGVVAVVQPYWFTGDPDYLAALRPLLGDRSERQYPMRSLVEAGVLVAGASDYPVTPPPDPLLAIQRGVLRRDPGAVPENRPLWPEEAVDVRAMIAAFTIAGEIGRASCRERV